MQRVILRAHPPHRPPHRSRPPATYMGKCVSKHPSLLTIALSEKDLATANQIWSKFAESNAEYIPPLKDKRHRNQLCASDAVGSSRNDNASDKHKQPQLQHHQQQQQQHQQQQQCSDSVDEKRERNENKSGQWTINEKLKRDHHNQHNRQDGDDAAADDGSDIAAVLVAKSGASGWHSDVDADVDIALHVANSRNDGHKVGQHHLEQRKQQQQLKQQQKQQQQQKTCLPHLRPQQHGDDVADSNNNDSVNVATAKEDKNHKNIKHKKQQQQQQQQNPNNNNNNKKKKRHKVKRKLQLINCVVAHEPETEAEDGAERLNYYSSNSHEQQQQQPPKQSLHSLANDEEHNGHAYKDEEGQTESKKHAKKHGNATGIETKGTAMSFGFRKKLNTTPKKLKKLLEGDIGSKKKHQQQDKCNNLSDGGGGGGTTDADGDTVDQAGTGWDTEMGSASQEGVKDDNGNAALVGKVHFEKVGAAAVAANNATSAAQRSNQANRTAAANGEQAPRADSPRPGAGNRFGYRGTNIVRPASTGLTPRHQSDMHDNMANNNCGQAGGEPKPLVSNLKRRSKSAHAGRALTSANDDDIAAGNGNGNGSGAVPSPKINQPKSITFNLNQNSTIEYQRRQFFQQPAAATSGRVAWPAYHAQPYMQQQQQQQQQQQSLQRNIIHTGMHTNVIVRPTPRAPPASYSKFTLHTVSLPRPEFPVAISLSAATPTTPGSTYTPSPTIATTAGSKAAPGKEFNAQQQQQHPLTAVAVSVAGAVPPPPPPHMDLKTAKHMANSTRRGFTGSREISADSGIASMDMALDSSTSSGGGGGVCGGRTASPKRSRSRPRNLQMVMSGRHKFEVRDLEDPLSSESSSLVEPLALPKLPTENQTAPLPLCGLVRSNTVLSRETYERNGGSNALKQVELDKSKPTAAGPVTRNSSEEGESEEGVDEEKLYLDRSTSEKSTKYYQFKDINTCSSKTSSPGSSIMLSWCNAGESLAVKDCSSLSISSSEDSNKVHEDKPPNPQNKATTHLPLDLIDDDLSIINTDMQVSTISSITETLSNNPTLDNNLEAQKLRESPSEEPKPDRPKSLYNTLNESKFAEMALAGSTYLLDDETSPTDSLVSSTESEEAASKQKKHKINEELQEKDIDEISPELEVGSPISPGTPTNASHSLSLSDCGNLIDDEIADQPALLFNSDAQDGADSLAASRKEKTETPTLMETTSLRSLKSQSRARSVLQQAIELSLRTPLSLRKAVMERAESLDTLSPCESICSDDLMMDFDMNSSVDSIDRSSSIRSRSGSDLHKIDETELFSELERKGSDVMKELNTIMRIHTNRNTEKDSVIAHLPARATRLLNRSRLQQQCPLTNADSDSSKSPHSIRGRSAAASRASTASNSTNASQQRSGQHHHNHHHNHHHHQQRELHSSSDDLMLYDKSFRNAMIQDVLQFKKQLLRLRRILQETETLNPFENDNGQLFASCGLDSKLLDDIDLASLTSSTTDDPMQELADLRRQVVYLQGQVEDRDRTIRLQRNRIESLEATKSAVAPALNSELAKECISMATQTERTRPLSIGAEGLSRSKPEYTSYTTYFPTVCGDATTIIQHQQQCPANQTRRHTIISTTLTNYHNQQLLHEPRRASIAWEKPTTTTTTTAAPVTTPTPASASATAPATPAIYKPVKITLIGEPLKQWPSSNGGAVVVESKRSLHNGSANGGAEQRLNGHRLLNGYGSRTHQQPMQQQQQKQLNHQNHSRQPTPAPAHYKSPHTNANNYNPTVTIV